MGVKAALKMSKYKQILTRWISLASNPGQHPFPVAVLMDSPRSCKTDIIPYAVLALVTVAAMLGSEVSLSETRIIRE